MRLCVDIRRGRIMAPMINFFGAMGRLVSRLAQPAQPVHVGRRIRYMATAERECYISCFWGAMYALQWYLSPSGSTSA